MKMKKVTAMSMAALMAATMIPSVPVMADGGGKVYYLNFKPEQDEAWQNLAKAYTEETGTDVTVVTAASGQYETTLQSEMAKSDAPTLFQVNGRKTTEASSWSSFAKKDRPQSRTAAGYWLQVAAMRAYRQRLLRRAAVRMCCCSSASLSSEGSAHLN